MNDLISIYDWFQQNEANSEARRKREILRGALPPQPDATMLGGSQTLPWYKQYKDGTAYKGKKKKSKKKKK